MYASYRIGKERIKILDTVFIKIDLASEMELAIKLTFEIELTIEHTLATEAKVEI